MKTEELTGPLLDHWVAIALGYRSAVSVPYELCGNWYAGECDGGVKDWSPSTDWSQAGPIIEREQIKIEHVGEYWDALIVAKTADVYYQAGPTPLVAAMRAYVASKFGEELPNISAD